MIVVKAVSGIWRILRLDLDQNHEILPRQREQMFNRHKYMTKMKKSLSRTLNDNNIPTRQMICKLSYLRGKLRELLTVLKYQI